MSEAPPFAAFQNEIYLGGMGGQVPTLPFTYAELERQAREKLDDGAFGYVAGAAGSEDTARANVEAFRKWRIVPRMLRDIGVRDLGVTVLGSKLSAPLMLAPIGVQSIVHPDAELAVARAAASVGMPMCLSTAASNTIEDVAEAIGDTPHWFQLYWPRDPDVAVSMMARAEESGYGAILVTLDTWLLGWRPRDLEGAYLPFLRGEGIANYVSDPAFRAQLAKPPEEDMQSAVFHFLAVYSDPTVTWDNLAFLRQNTKLPLVLKGILHPEDARRALDYGVDGVLVSNHGGRQVDGAIAALDALPSVVDSVPGDFPVLFDSGVRCGADVFKALALGARLVLLGRPYMWGLALAGEDGVRHVARSYLAELDLTLALAGYTSIEEVSIDALVAL